MEMMNTQTAGVMAVTLPQITASTTLGEVLAVLNHGEKPKMPTPKVLFETAGEPIAKMNDCILFSNGFAVYQNRSGRTVVWLPYCTNFKYYFNKLRDSEKDTLKETYELPEGFLKTQPWFVAVTLIGEHRIEQNSMNRTGSRTGTSDFSSQYNGDKGGEMESIAADPYRRAFNWYDGHMGENPQDAVERRETREEMLAAMTDKQREVFVMYYRDGVTQDQIAEFLGISKMSVNERLRYALTKAKNFF
jgi:RNA polymerase sigma factor (sigma-70 family)